VRLLLAAVVPWVAAVPPAPVAPRTDRPCAAGSLRAELGLQGATGSLAGGVVFTNRGPRPCSLLGPVRAQLVGGRDRAGVRLRAAPAEPSQPGVPHPWLRALRTGDSAFLRIWWSNWCGRPRPAALGVAVGGLSFRLPLQGTARCDAPGAASTLSVGPLEPRAPQPLPSSRLPLAAAIVEQLELGPKTVPGIRGRRGHSAVYHVALTNTSPLPFRFGKACPAYAEGTGLGLPVELHVLNCHPVREIRPRQTIVFEMRIRVPSSAPLGRDALTWTLAPATYEPPFAGGVVLVGR
jgi:hypothetical protein